MCIHLVQQYTLEIYKHMEIIKPGNTGPVHKYCELSAK
jgi:hypothetical protein